MRRLIGIVTATLLACVSAQAADLPVKPFAPAPAMWSWTGWYAGLNAGYGWSKIDHDVGLDGAVASVQTDGSGFIGGLYGGYNWQATNWLIVGVETDIAWSAIKGTNDISGKVDTVPFTTHAESKLNWLGTTRARIGFTPWQSLMLYGTGGVAYGKIEDSVSSCFGCSSLNSSFATSGSSSTTKAGWAAGAGVEYAITSNVLARIEWLHYDLGTASLFAAAGAATASTKHDGDIVRGGVAWKF